MHASFFDYLNLAEALEDFPTLANDKTESDFKRAFNRLQRMQDSVEHLSSFDEKLTAMSG